MLLQIFCVIKIDTMEGIFFTCSKRIKLIKQKGRSHHETGKNRSLHQKQRRLHQTKKKKQRDFHVPRHKNNILALSHPVLEKTECISYVRQNQIPHI
jgi:hypothetical protein